MQNISILVYDIIDDSCLLRIRKLRPKIINLLMDTQVEEPEFESKPFSSISKEWNMLENGRSGVNFGGIGKVGKFQSRTSSQVHQRWEPRRQQKKVGGHKEYSITSVFGPLSSSLSQGSKCGE